MTWSSSDSWVSSATRERPSRDKPRRHSMARSEETRNLSPRPSSTMRCWASWPRWASRRASHSIPTRACRASSTRPRSRAWPCHAPSSMRRETRRSTTGRDKDGAYLMGDKQYRLRVPAKPPVKRFWAVTAYNPISRSLLNSDGPITVSSLGDPEVNEDGSVDIYFGASAPRGRRRTGSSPIRPSASSWSSGSTARSRATSTRPGCSTISSS